MPKHKISGSDEMKCKEDGCEKPVQVKLRQLCRSHFQRWRREERKRTKNQVCTLDYCNNAYYAKGYCQNHYAKWLRYGQPERPPKPVVLCECGNQATGNGRCKACYGNWHYYNGPTGPLDTTARNFKGDDVGYSAAHLRVRRVRGRAKEHDCVLCGGPAHSWGLKHTVTDIKFGRTSGRQKNISAYSLDPYDYQAMCDPCHRAYDKEHKNRAYKLQESRWSA